MIINSLKNIDNKGFGGIRLALPDKLTSDHGDLLQSMVDVDLEEKELVFSPFKGYDMLSISLEDDFLRHMAAINSYLAPKTNNAAENLNISS